MADTKNKRKRLATEDDCAPDAAEHFEAQFKQHTGLTTGEFIGLATKYDLDDFIEWRGKEFVLVADSSGRYLEKVIDADDLRVQGIIDRVKEQNRFLAAKGTVVLTVNLSTEEEAQELYEWLYSDDKPMKSSLTSISWDQVLVPKRVAEAIETIKGVLY